MAPSKQKHLDDAVVEESDDETVDGEEEVEEEEEEEEENDAVEAEDGAAKSDDDAEEEEEEEDDEDEEEEKTEKPLPKKTPLPSSSAAASEEEDPESGSETESDNTNQSPSASAYTIKPIASKPVNDAYKPSKKAPPAKPKSGSKRPAEAEEPKPKDSKKKKVTSGGDDEDAKRGRLWSEDDETAILKGLIEFQSKKGAVNATNMGQFHEFVKKNLQADVVTAQLADKIRRLRKKYQDNAKKSGDNGEGPAFSKPHESKSFDLSKKVWGVEANGVEDNAKGGKGKPRKSNKGNKDTVLALPVSDSGEKKEELNNVANGGVETGSDDFWSKYPCLSGSLKSNCSPGEDLARIMIERMPLIGPSKVEELEEKWRALQVNEMELSVKKLDLMQEQAKLVLESVKSSKD